MQKKCRFPNFSKSFIPIKQWFSKWALPPPVGVGKVQGGVVEKRGGTGALKPKGAVGGR